MSFKLAGTLSGVQPTQIKCSVNAGTESSIAPGDLVFIGTGAVAFFLSNGGAVNADGKYGLAVSTSTETAGAAGTVEVVVATDLLVRGVVSTPANLNSSLLYTKCSVDVIGGVQSIDEDDAGAMTIVSIVEGGAEGEITALVPFTL